MKNFCAHKKQFLIGSRPVQVNENWQSIKIEENLYLSYCPELLVRQTRDLNGKEWHLLGIAVQTDKEKADPLVEIEHSLTDDVGELYRSWTGRWILVGDNRIQTDCCGLLGCFYTNTSRHPWISSSLAILHDIELLSPRPETLKHTFGIEWYPLPTSRFEGISKILPSQVLNLKTFSPEPRALPKPINGLLYGEILEKIIEKLKFTLLNISDLGKEIFIALTAGYDSRVVLAACCYAGIKVKTFTRVDQGTAYHDVILPPKLSKASGYTHDYIKESSFSKGKEELYDCHVAGNIDHIARKKFSNGQYDYPTKDDIILSGGVFEVARCYYWKKMNPALNIQTIITAMGLHYSPESYNVRALTEWVKWVEQTPTEGLDWRDRLYLEQRVAGWLSSLQQALDVTNTVSLHVMNCHDLISLFLSIPVEKRSTDQHQVDLINQMCPILLKIPFNPPDPAFLKLQKKAVKLSKVPIAEVYKKLKKKLFN